MPDLGRDEFGSMGGIFNDVMIDLEELSVAGAIQEQLLPQQQIETGCFSLFGRSIAMGELGGDYFDHIEISNDKFSVLLGDVAGHGVGAALIMAMAKAGIIQSEDLLDQPLALLNRLHGLIYASKTKKQKKIMTFQYLCVEAQNGKATYANAGACSPIIIRKSQDSAEELTLAGAALGAFKKPNYSEITIDFAPGDAIVFYTDGIVEARNSRGEELGYDNLKILLKNCWNENAETFYNNIYQNYMKHLGDEGAQDDLTIVILVYTGQKKQEPAPEHETA
jgi:serine phosphatase RsbU (regulator of sigma subunit)